jgi:urease accessory protein
MPALELVRLLQLSDSLFPVGAYAYSDGLEAAVQSRRITTAADLDGWLAHFVRHVFVASEGRALFQGCRALVEDDWDTLVRLDCELTALRPAAAARASSSAIGRRCLKTCLTTFDDPAFAAADARLPHANAAVAYAVVSHCLGVAPRDAMLAFGYTRLAGYVSAALRLMPIGQHQGQIALRRAADLLPAAVDEIVEHADEPLRSFSPWVDVCQMNHRHLYSRLFRS